LYHFPRSDDNWAEFVRMLSVVQMLSKLSFRFHFDDATHAESKNLKFHYCLTVFG
ncbi:hypothetical protein T4B_4518, partial [Trichinella pseudospiralis]